MVKKHLYQTLCLAAALAMTACTQDELAENPDTLPPGKYPLEIGSVTLTAEVSEQPWGAKSPQTRVTESGDGNSSVWENLDEFYAKTAGANENGTYRIANAAAGTVTATRTTYWTKTTDDVTAWYPKSGMVSLADQSGKLAYVLQATATNASYNSPVELKFKHKLAKVRVKLNSSYPIPVVESVKILSYTQCTHTAGNNVNGTNEGEIIMHKVDDNTYEANVVPGYKIEKIKVNNDENWTTLSTPVTPVAEAVNEIALNVSIEDFIVKDGTYIVTSATGLQEWGKHVRNGNWNTNCILAADITLPEPEENGSNWIPIGTSTAVEYTGTFDGAGHTISGLDITSSDSRYFGFIGHLTGTVKNLTITNAAIVGTSSAEAYVGGIVAYGRGGTIHGCGFQGTVTAKGATQSYAGGIVGYSDINGERRSNLYACWSNATVAAEDGKYIKYAGVIVGGTNRVNNFACYYTGELKGIGKATNTTDNTKKVDENEVTWATAATEMNEHLTGYKWEVNEGNTDVPLKLVKQ